MLVPGTGAGEALTRHMRGEAKISVRPTDAKT